MPRSVLRLAGPVFALAGVLHFVRPSAYERIIPPWIPAHREMVYLSGVAELVTGASLSAPDRGLRRAGGLLGAATMVGVFPCHVYMAANPERFTWVPGGRPALYARMPLQLVFIAWLLAAGWRED